jgi:hypothetical protein
MMVLALVPDAVMIVGQGRLYFSIASVHAFI